VAGAGAKGAGHEEDDDNGGDARGGPLGNGPGGQALGHGGRRLDQGLAGDDALYGIIGGNNFLYGQLGHDGFYGRSDDDVILIYGGKGDDRLEKRTVHGGSGRDVL
jgi:RTX calcium-binding nonapeptide repeat (4 copies)